MNEWDGVKHLLPKRVVEKIRLVSGPLPEPCWEWTGARDADGYGRVGAGYQNRKASRLVYEALCGTIPESLELDHLCQNRPCVNPSHLEPVKHEVNVARGNAGKYLRQRTHCPKGHSYDATNIYIYYWKGNVKRGCRICRSERSREWGRRQRVAQ